MAWTKNVLRVNLEAGTCATEPLNMAWAHDYLGQRGLATKYFVSEVDPDGRSVLAREQAHLRDRAAHGHHGRPPAGATP